MKFDDDDDDGNGIDLTIVPFCCDCSVPALHQTQARYTFERVLIISIANTIHYKQHITKSKGTTKVLLKCYIF